MNAAPETTQYFPKPGRTPPTRLHVVPNPFQEDEHTTCVRPTGKATWKDILRMRGELPEPTRGPSRKSEPVACVPPYLRKGYRWDLLGEALHVHLRHEASKPAAIRSCPPTLAKLLATPEWRGSTVSDPTADDIRSLYDSAARSVRDAQAAELLAKGKANKARARALTAAREARVGRLHEARRVVHPSGAVLLWHPL